VASENDRGEWAGREYLGIYDRIEYGRMRGHSEDVWMVRDHEANTAWQLQDWL
jgi:hypothetical protein